MTNLTHLPGFQDPVHDAQETFRGLLDANARPGIAYSITAKITAPPGLTPACAAACLSLLDLDVVVWLQPNFAPEIKAWLVFHTGCGLTQQPQEADFALIQDLATSSELSSFSWGTAEQPETSTTLLVQVESFQGGQSVILTGPGILDKRAISPTLPANFWDFWAQNHQAYPQGLDVLLFTENAVMGLPRTAKSEICDDC
ncbi:phosphonate C-P lyase system protein PhnH [Calothrix sp. PCC 7507]|uniref:phosphonate C-P lyase system protein PhnH n=1 Tax=Calothrix sp. PCC 7507 TaxID=99598 RepID=UPI00029F018E|nr:phosphonate C-P lyase system protein PhnH [Calothrix sp. PCC 7507]AFY34823.1 phosphonate C-P lyase system protein PhnH [Calothrix sp. PCC 7507]